MTEAEEGCLSLIVETFLYPVLAFVVGWVAGWLIQVLFLGEPYMTAAGYDLKVMIGLVLGGIVLARYVLIMFFLMLLALFELA